MTLAVLAGGLAALAGCALFGAGKLPPKEPQSPARVSVRFCLASSQEAEGYREAADEHGWKVYVAADAFLTDREIWSAAVFTSDRKSLVRLDFTHLGATVLERVTREHVGGRLAIFINDDLVMSPVVQGPIANGKLYLDGDFSKARADEIARGLNAQRASLGPDLGRPEP